MAEPSAILVLLESAHEQFCLPRAVITLTLRVWGESLHSSHHVVLMALGGASWYWKINAGDRAGSTRDSQMSRAAVSGGGCRPLYLLWPPVLVLCLCAPSLYRAYSLGHLLTSSCLVRLGSELQAKSPADFRALLPSRWRCANYSGAQGQRKCG